VEKYEKDLLALGRANQQLLSENKSVAGVLQQNTTLTGMVRQLQTQVRERSMVVDHLW